MRPRKLLVILDCCHAGALSGVKLPGLAKEPLPPELEAVLRRGSGRVVIASSRRDEYSYTGSPYSVFTQAFREAPAGLLFGAG